MRLQLLHLAAASLHHAKATAYYQKKASFGGSSSSKGSKKKPSNPFACDLPLSTAIATGTNTNPFAINLAKWKTTSFACVHFRSAGERTSVHRRVQVRSQYPRSLPTRGGSKGLLERKHSLVPTYLALTFRFPVPHAFTNGQ